MRIVDVENTSATDEIIRRSTLDALTARVNADEAILAGKATDTAVLHLAGAETATGLKTFSAGAVISGGMLLSESVRTAVSTALTTASNVVNIIDATNNAVVVSLPSNAAAGQIFVFLRSDGSTNQTSVAALGGGTIQGYGSSLALYQYDCYILEAAPTANTWRVLSRSGMGAFFAGAATARTTAFSALPGFAYPISLPAGLGAVTISLPNAPNNGTVIAFTRIDSNSLSSFAQITPTGTDTMLGGLPFYSLSGSSAIFLYENRVWSPLAVGYAGMSGVLGPVSSYDAQVNTGNNLMRRDGSGRAQVNDPVAAQDIATRNYVDGAVRSVSANTVANNRDVILANASGGPITITIPVTAGSQVTVKRMDSTSNTLTVLPASGTIDGDPNATIWGSQTSAVFGGDGTNARIEAVYDTSLINGAGLWTPFTPALTDTTTGAVVPGTIVSARYLVIGSTCWAQVQITATAASANGVQADLPFTARDRILNCGTLGISGGTPPADQSGMAYMSADKAHVICVAYSNGFRAIASGQTLRYNVVYELP